ncbi:alpha/beta fold hydrolase [Noviherbaspirillum massiliense]|uniref:alpha/beta fold hydrolase n=1 Tax=Noviherbaspirillum massiliense TaxID=1465823 RepID=UPI000363A28E|nr:alpha/beta fold hydrolase [Noviherbaspirillum massiliense]
MRDRQAILRRACVVEGFEDNERMNMLQPDSVHPARMLFARMDKVRQRQGALLDAAGFGPEETPWRSVHAEAGVRLRQYGEASAEGPVLFIVPAPIKRPYIWDLAPEVSVVRRCLAQGMRVYLVEWTPCAKADVGLADYGDRLLKLCFDAIAADSGEGEVILAGHSLGGVLATLFACLYPQRVRALLLLETPLHFGPEAGDFAPLVAATADASLVAHAFGTVPGSFLSFVSTAAAPHAFQWQRCIDWWLSAAHPDALATHMRVERWACDEFPLPGRLFAEILEWLYRDDRLMKGNLLLGSRPIGPRDLRAPLLNVIDPRSTIIPPQSILPFHDAAASTAKKVLRYEGDIGVGIQHVGALVGSRAHARLWPAIFDWLMTAGAMRRGKDRTAGRAIPSRFQGQHS